MRPPFSDLIYLDVRAPVAGLLDTPQPDLLPPNAATVSYNAHHDRLAIQRRLGRVLVGNRLTLAGHRTAHALYHFRKRDGTEELLCVRHEYLYKLSGATWVGAISGAATATAADVIGNDTGFGYFIQYVDRLYWWDGGVLRKYYEATTPAIRDWGWQGGALPVPTWGTANSGGSKTDTAKYRFVYTYYSTTTGHETDPSDEVATDWTVASPNQQRDVVIPLNASWDPLYDVIRIYSTFGNGAGDYYFEMEHTVNYPTEDLTAAPITITNGLSKEDGQLGGKVSFDNAPPPQLLYCVLENEQVVGVDAEDPSRVVYSKTRNPQAWPPVNEKYLERDSGDPIAGMFVLLGRLYVIKKYGGIFVLSANATGGFNREKLTGDYGCSHHFSIQTVGTHAYWWEPKGAVRFDGQNVENISDGSIRQTVRSLLAGANFGDIYAVHDGQADKMYVRWCVEDPATNVKIHLIFDTMRQAWMIDWPGSFIPDNDTGAADRVLELVQDTDGNRWVYTADDDGRVFRLRTDLSGNPVYNDNGEGFVFRWAGPWFCHKDDPTGVILSVLPLYIDLEYEKSASGITTNDLVVQFWRDLDESASYDVNVPLYDTGDGSRFVRINLDRAVCGRFRVGFKCDGQSSDVSILRYAVAYKPIAVRVRGLP